MNNKATLALFAFFILFPYNAYATSKLKVYTTHDNSRIYVDGVFRGVCGSLHKQALEITLKPGVHFVEALKVAVGPILLYSKRGISLQAEKRITLGLDMREHPESDKLDWSQFKEEDYITATLPKDDSQSETQDGDQSITASVDQKKPKIQFVAVQKQYLSKFNLDDGTKEHARRYRALRARQQARNQQHVTYSLGTPPPGMVEVPGGSFCGSAGNDCKSVRIKPFWIAEKEVTVKQWSECMQSGACPSLLGAINASNPEQAISGVSYLDAKKYLQWLSESLGVHARLPTDEEWEYAAQANQDTRYPWGETYLPARSNCLERGHEDAGIKIPAYPGVVGRYAPNGFGLYDVVGNVEELSSTNKLRGGSWRMDCDMVSLNHVTTLRSKDARRVTAGFRVAMNKIEPVPAREAMDEYYCVDEKLFGVITYHPYSHYSRCFLTKTLDAYIEKNGL